MSKKTVVASHLSCRVHLCCDFFSCFELHDALKEIHLIPSRPPELNLIISLWSQGQMANSLGVWKFKSNNNSRFFLAPNLRMLAKLAPSTHTSGSNSAIFEAAATRQFFVHALRIRTEDAAQRRDVAGPGRLVDVAASARLRGPKFMAKKKNPSKFIVFPKTSKNHEKIYMNPQKMRIVRKKPCEEVYFGPKILICERNIPIHWRFTGFDAMFWCIGMGRRCIRMGGKDRATSTWKTDPKQGISRSKISTWFCRRCVCLLQKRQMAHTTNNKGQKSLIFNISTPRNSMKFSNWLEPKWHRRCHNPAGFRKQ